MYYYLTLKWLGMLSLLNDWLSILILVKALKSSGINLTEHTNSEYAN